MGTAQLLETGNNRTRSVGRAVRRPYPDSEESDNDVWYAEEHDTTVQQVSRRKGWLTQTANNSCGEGCAQLDDFKWFLPAKERAGDLTAQESEIEMSDSESEVEYILPLTTVVSIIDDVSTVTPFVVPAPPDIERPVMQAQELSNCRLIKSRQSSLLISLSASSSALTLPWNPAKFSSSSFSLDRLQPLRGKTLPPTGEALLPPSARCGSQTQIGVSYASALLVPCWQIMSFFVHAGPVAWIMWFLFVG